MASAVLNQNDSFSGLEGASSSAKAAKVSRNKLVTKPQVTK